MAFTVPFYVLARASPSGYVAMRVYASLFSSGSLFFAFAMVGCSSDFLPLTLIRGSLDKISIPEDCKEDNEGVSGYVMPFTQEQMLPWRKKPEAPTRKDKYHLFYARLRNPLNTVNVYFGFDTILPPGIRFSLACQPTYFSKSVKIRKMGRLLSNFNFDEQQYYRIPESCISAGYVLIHLRTENSPPISTLNAELRVLEAPPGHQVPVTDDLVAHLNKDSFSPGDQIELKMHSVAPKVRGEVIRFGESEKSPLLTIEEIPGQKQTISPFAFEKGTHWPTSWRFKVPKEWRSGYYALRLSAGKATFSVPFLVLPDVAKPPAIAVIASTNTWQAYNGWAGASLYKHKKKGCIRVNNSDFVSFDRPNPGADPFTKLIHSHLAGPEVELGRWLDKN